MTRDILLKLTDELKAGITTEAQVVYLLVGTRKIIERDDLGGEFPVLNFHCNWALHSHLDRRDARAVLEQFADAHLQLCQGAKLKDLEPAVRTEIDNISKMRFLEEQLSEFLRRYELPPLTLHYPDGWARFLYLYAKVVEDIPLVVTLNAAIRNGARGAVPNVSRVTIHCETARENPRYGDEEHVLFAVTWVIEDRNGQSGELRIINSFEV